MVVAALQQLLVVGETDIFSLLLLLHRLHLPPKVPVRAAQPIPEWRPIAVAAVVAAVVVVMACCAVLEHPQPDQAIRIAKPPPERGRGGSGGSQAERNAMASITHTSPIACAPDTHAETHRATERPPHTVPLHARVERVPRQRIAGVALHGLPRPQRREEQQAGKVRLEDQRGNHAREDVEHLWRGRRGGRWEEVRGGVRTSIGMTLQENCPTQADGYTALLCRHNFLVEKEHTGATTCAANRD
jgi:hypothetical protein